jgi:hypothetical protein
MTHSLTLKSAILSALTIAAVCFLYQPISAQNNPVEATFEDLRFMEGKWTGTFRGDRQYEAYWSGPEGNAIMGMIRFIVDDKTTLFELLTIENTERGLVLSVKHFEPGMLGRQEKDDAVRYRLIETGDKRAVFVHEGNGSRLAMEGADSDVHLVRGGVLEDGNWVWNDIFVGTRAE